MFWPHQSMSFSSPGEDKNASETAEVHNDADGKNDGQHKRAISWREKKKLVVIDLVVAAAVVHGVIAVADLAAAAAVVLVAAAAVV